MAFLFFLCFFKRWSMTGHPYILSITWRNFTCLLGSRAHGMRGLIACELCVYNRHMSEYAAFVCCLQSGVVLELHRTAAAQIKPTNTLASLQTNGMKGSTMNECLEDLLAICYPCTLTKTVKSTVTDEEQ